MSLLGGLYLMLAGTAVFFGDSFRTQWRAAYHMPITVINLDQKWDGYHSKVKSRFPKEQKDPKLAQIEYEKNLAERARIGESACNKHDREWRLQYACSLNYEWQKYRGKSAMELVYDDDFRLDSDRKHLATHEEVKDMLSDIEYVKNIQELVHQAQDPWGVPFIATQNKKPGDLCSSSDFLPNWWIIREPGELPEDTGIPVSIASVPRLMEDGGWRFGETETDYMANLYFLEESNAPKSLHSFGIKDQSFLPEEYKGANLELRDDLYFYNGEEKTKLCAVFESFNGNIAHMNAHDKVCLEARLAIEQPIYIDGKLERCSYTIIDDGINAIYIDTDIPTMDYIKLQGLISSGEITLE